MTWYDGMTREQYENYLFIDESAERFHARTGKYPTKTEAIRKIREHRRVDLFPAGLSWGKRAIQKRSYYRFAMSELIARISDSKDDDPIRIIYEFWNSMDDAVTGSDSRRVWIFAGDMRDAAHDALDLLE